MEVDIKKLIEALLFVSEQPLTLGQLQEVIGDEVSAEEIESVIKNLIEDYNQRMSPVEIRQLAGGYQMLVKKEYFPWVRKLYKERLTIKLSPSALETLAIIAFKQPITRSEIESIRGVEVTAVLESLLEKKLIRICGRKETVGRPLLYATTTEFLRYFGLKSLSDLPLPEEISAPYEPVTSPEVSEEVVSEDISGETGEPE